MTQTTHTTSLDATRRALHQVAEHVLSAARKRATGEISLVAGEGGVRTPPFGDGLVLGVVGTDIAVIDHTGVRRAPLRTVRQAAEFAGTEPGFPWTKHPPATDFTPDEPLRIDAGHAKVLADWFALGDSALRDLAAQLAPEAAPVPQLFPEHFDLAITVADVNYGASPGDDAIPEPYLYVGPHSGPPVADDFWNAPFGASLTSAAVRSPADALAFFLAGHDRVVANTRSTS